MSGESGAMSGCPEMDYFMNESVSDVVFVIEGQRLPANKLYLSFKSRVFRAMFLGKFKESKDKEVVIKDTTFEAFKTLIVFIHIERFVLEDNTDFTHIDEVCRLCDMYEVLRLRDKICEHLTKMSITSENMEPIARLAFKYQFRELMAKVKKFIYDNFEPIINYDPDQLIALTNITNGELILIAVDKYRKLITELRQVMSGSFSLSVEPFEETLALITHLIRIVEFCFHVIRNIILELL